MKIAKFQRMGPDQIAERIGVPMFRDAYEHGMSLSGLLERLDPTEPGDKTGLDAFGRVMQHLQIATRSVPEAGVYADVWREVFDESPERRLLGREWMHRQWRRAAYGADPSTARATDTLLSADYAVGTPFMPWFDQLQPRISMLTAPIPLARLVAITTPITGTAYRAVYLIDPDPNSLRFVRVGETGEIPKMLLRESTGNVSLYKYGRGIAASYEVMRRQRLDRVQLEIGLMATQTENDKVATVLDVMLNGDGNSFTAPTAYNLTTLDPSTTAGTLTNKAWLAFKLKFPAPYTLTSALMQESAALSLATLTTGTANWFAGVVAGQENWGGLAPMQDLMQRNVEFGWTADAPANKIIGFDRTRAIERVVEIGSDITEIERHASNQTQDIYMTEVEGYDVIDPKSVKVLVLNA